MKMINFARSSWHKCNSLPGCNKLKEVWRVLFWNKLMRLLCLHTHNAEDIVLGVSKEEKARFKNHLGLCLLLFCKEEFVDTVIIWMRNLYSLHSPVVCPTECPVVACFCEKCHSVYGYFLSAKMGRRRKTSIILLSHEIHKDISG